MKMPSGGTATESPSSRSTAVPSAPTVGDRRQDWNDLELRIQTAATRLEHQAIRVQELTHISDEEKTDELNRLSAKRSGVLLCLDYMRGYGGD